MIHPFLKMCLLSSLIVLQSFKLEAQTDSVKVHNTDILEIAAHVLHIKDIKEQPDSLSKTHHPFFVIIPGIFSQYVLINFPFQKIKMIMIFEIFIGAGFKFLFYLTG